MMKSLAAAASALLVQAAPLLACAGCREPGEDVEAATVMAGFGFSWGVMIMLGHLAILCGVLGTYLVRSVRAADARHDAGP